MLCACAFVDVGLNDGGTLTTWPKTAHRLLSAVDEGTLVDNPRNGGYMAVWQRMFVEAAKWPSRRGAGATAAELSRCLNHTSDTCYSGFEPSPGWEAHLRNAERHLKAQRRRVQIHTTTAFSTQNGFASFVSGEGCNDPRTCRSTGSFIEPEGGGRGEHARLTRTRNRTRIATVDGAEYGYQGHTQRTTLPDQGHTQCATTATRLH